MAGIRWSESVDRHDVPLADAVHAMLEYYVHKPSFDVPRRPGGLRPDLWLGPPRQLGGPLLEVMAEVNPADYDVRIFHVMEMRPKWFPLMVEAGYGHLVGR